MVGSTPSPKASTVARRAGPRCYWQTLGIWSVGRGKPRTEPGPPVLRLPDLAGLGWAWGCRVFQSADEPGYAYVAVLLGTLEPCASVIRASTGQGSCRTQLSGALVLDPLHACARLVLGAAGLATPTADFLDLWGTVHRECWPALVAGTLHHPTRGKDDHGLCREVVRATRLVVTGLRAPCCGCRDPGNRIRVLRRSGGGGVGAADHPGTCGCSCDDF